MLEREVLYDSTKKKLKNGKILIDIEVHNGTGQVKAVSPV